MRVLLVNDYGVASGGAERQMLALRAGLRERGHEARLFSSDARPVSGYPILADSTCRGRTDLAQAVTQAVNPSAWLALRREIARRRPDVVHLRMFLWQLSPLVLQALGDVPTLFQAAVYKAICPNGLKLLPDGSVCERSAGRACLDEGCVRPATWCATMLQLSLLRAWRSRIDRVATLSRRMATLFEREGWSPVEVIGNGVDVTAPRSPLGEDPVIAYAGRLSREKGVASLIDAFARVGRERPRARLLIAGAGPEEGALRERARALGTQVEFLGHLSIEDMHRAFERAWAQVVPSLWHEPFGNVSTEAMMRGIAVVAADVGGQSDIVRDGLTGYLFPPGDVGALAARLARLCDDRPLAEALGARGRRTALADHSRDAVLDRLERVYAEMLAARSPARAS